MPREIGPDLATLKRRQRDEINQARETAGSQPVTVAGIRYDADAAARANITGTAAAVANGASAATIRWRDADDVTRQLTPAEFVAMATAVMGQYQAAFEHSFVLKDQVTAATTPAQVRAVVWDRS